MKNNNETIRRGARFAAAAFAVAGVVATAHGTVACSGADTTEVGTTDEAASGPMKGRGRIALDPASDKLLEEMGSPVLARGNYQLTWAREVLDVGSKPIAVDSDSLSVTTNANGTRALVRALADGSHVTATTNDRAVAQSPDQAPRLLRYQLPQTLAPRAQSFLEGNFVDAAKAEILSMGRYAAVEYAQRVAPIGVLAGAGPRVVVLAQYIARSKLHGDDGNGVLPPTPRIGPQLAARDAQVGIAFTYWVLVPGTRNELLPIAQSSVLYPQELPDSAPLDANARAFAMAYYVDPARSVLPAPLAAAATSALAMLPASHELLHLNYLPARLVPLKPPCP